MIFISYRIADSNEMTAWLDADLARVFGRDNVFRDKKRLKGGDKWPKVLDDAAKSCRVMLVVIGDKWQSAHYTDADRAWMLRLHDPDDWVRKEISLALEYRRIVIPVLLNGHPMPTRNWLNVFGLNELADCQAEKLRTDDYETDRDQLIRQLKDLGCPVTPAADAGPAQRMWQRANRHPLQPAPFFSGRGELIDELCEWVNDPLAEDRVVALVAAGGTGKTALAEWLVAQLPQKTPFGVFIWSFYENPRTEAFLREACEYFLGQAPTEPGGLLEQLQHGLKEDELPHLLVLDGLEVIQATEGSGRRRGQLEDPLLRRLLVWLANGKVTRAKVLITSRFPLPELADWTDYGFRPHSLEDLDPPAARAVLRHRGVKGSDAILDDLAGSVHWHALTVDVLGSYLGTFHGGEPAKAPSVDPKYPATTDPKTARLHRVLTGFAEKLSPQERDLLARLSIFPRGVGVDVLGYLVDAGGQVAATLVGCDQIALLKLLERLQGLGLVFRYDAGGTATFTAHPFLREFFETLLWVDDPKQIHAAVRDKLVVGLEERPAKHPTDPADLDRYERLIEVTRLAGDVQKAFDLYLFGLGGYKHLGWVIGNNSRGLRIVSGFSPDGTPPHIDGTLSDRDRSLLATDWGLYAENLGDLTTARLAFEIANGLAHDLNLSIGFQNVADVELVAGRWPRALEAALSALSHAKRVDDETVRTGSHARIGAALGGLGRLPEARGQFAEATKLQIPPALWAYSGILEAELSLEIGGRVSARTQTEANLDVCHRSEWTSDIASCQTILGRCVLPEDPPAASRHLAAAREYAGRSGDVEVALRCYHLSAEVARLQGDFPRALSEAQDGIQLADSCGFGRWSLDIRTELARIHLANDDPKSAIDPAEWVLRRSREKDCQYAWGEADSLHLLGIAHARLGDKKKARQYLTEAVEKRQPLEHPGLEETEVELRKLDRI